ncbi:MAG: helix-turn-helix domain-containing protein [Ruminococcaceae bacterium]|nr:helix-turn-helix domain-containing protein [Oscillospiraceae bacterium]
MSKNLLTIFQNEKEIIPENLISLKLGVKKRTGEQFAKATTNDGKTYIKSFSYTGVEEQKLITIPNYLNKNQRNEIIKDLARTYTQDDIADMLGVSQSTVSNVLRNNTANKK